MNLSTPLQGKNVLLAVTGGIAAYKAPNIVRLLKQYGANVRVILTTAAKNLVSPLALQTVSENPVHDALFSLEQECNMGHIELANWADFLVIAPLTANSLAKMALGLADDLLSTLYLVYQGQILIAPAMNTNMWQHQSTQSHLLTLKKQGVYCIGPINGSLACGITGMGKMSAPEVIIDELISIHEATKRHVDLKVLITAGPTIEAIDPVRYIANHSSGKMGYALAQSFVEKGARVTLISGPSSLRPPNGVNFIAIKSADEMLNAVTTHLKGQHIFIGAAAVSDYKAEEIFDKKQEKAKSLTLKLVKNPDIIHYVAHCKNRPQQVIGFAAQTHNALEKAKEKRLKKGLDAIICNEINEKNPAFNADDNAVSFISEKGIKNYPKQDKLQLARKLADCILETLEIRNLNETIHSA